MPLVLKLEGIRWEKAIHLPNDPMPMEEIFL